MCYYAITDHTRLVLIIVTIMECNYLREICSQLYTIICTISSYCCVRQDGTRFNQCAFNYSDNLVIINQVTPVTIQNKNHLEIIQIRTQIKLVI